MKLLLFINANIQEFSELLKQPVEEGPTALLFWISKYKNF